MNARPLHNSHHASDRPRARRETRGLIEIRIRDIRQLFNTLDATPFPEQDLDTDAEDFILGWAMEHPRDAELRIRIHIDQPPGDAEQRERTAGAIRNFFRYRAGAIQRQFRRLLSRGRVSLIIGLSCLAASVTGAELIGKLTEGTVFEILRESMLIGGWVAMWRPLEIFLYDWWPLRHERRVCERLSRAAVEIIDARERA